MINKKKKLRVETLKGKKENQPPSKMGVKTGGMLQLGIDDCDIGASPDQFKSNK